MYCKQCKITYHADEKFCRLCGEKLRERKQGKIKQQKQKSAFVSNIYLLFALGLAIFIIALLMIDRKESGRSTPASRPLPETPVTFTSSVYEVAEKFICPCGGCGEMDLDTCSCDMERGAIEAKTFIQRQLNQGKTKDEVIAAMIQQYGYLKPEYQREYLR